MPSTWNLLLSFLWILPWLLIALAALLALRRKKKSPQLLLQLIGAAGTILILPSREIVLLLLRATHAPDPAFTATRTIFGFLTYTLLLLFALGYTWEKLGRR
ncbi:MAG: hypothetical protein ACTHN5_09325 [Phycisphaerae bacterium]